MQIQILVVDDNRDTLRMYSRALKRKIQSKRLSYNLSSRPTDTFVAVQEADIFTTALEKLNNEKLDILVVDLKIPGPSGEEMGGLELIKESLRLDPLRPIIAITGYGSIALARKTLTQGVFDFIEKSTSAVDELVDSVQRAINFSDEKIMRAGNPFTPMSGMEPTVFGGRTKELEFFEQKINRIMHSKFTEHFVVLGNWGIGKSTLLREYKKICQSRGHIVSIVPLEPIQTGANLITAALSIVEGVLRGLPYPIDKFKKLLDYFESIGFTILGTGLQFSRHKRKINPQAFLYDTLIKLWQDLKDKTEIIVILLDDVDNFMAVPEIVMTLKQTLSMESVRDKKILFGLATAPTYWIELTSLKKHHPLSRYFLSRVELEPLTENELRETIIKSLIGTGVSFNKKVLDRVYEYTGGHPFEMQVLCSHLFNNQLSRKVDTDVWEKALLTTLNDLGMAIFYYWYSQASSNESKVLRLIAMEDTPVTMKKIQGIAKESKIQLPPMNIPKFLQRLLDKKLIEKSGRGLYIIPDRMFRVFLRNLSD